MKKYSKRVLGFLLAMVMVFTAAASGVLKTSVNTAAQGSISVGDIIDYGLYPQSKVTDEFLIASLDSQPLQAGDTVTFSGEKYLMIKFAQYTSLLTTGASNDLNSYQDDNGYYIDTVNWFKFEPVQWRVLSKTNGVLFLMAEKILESRAYNQETGDITWENCDLRNWLNADFYNTAFSETEKPRILTSTVVNNDNPLYGTDGGGNTSDKLFLLSLDEMITSDYGFIPDYYASDSKRQAQGTDFSKSQGLFVSTEDLYNGNSNWWLRSPGVYSSDASYVDVQGRDPRSYVNMTYFGVRPALKINLSSVISRITFNSAGGTVVESLTGKVDSPVIAPADPEKFGFNFEGWEPELPSAFPEGGLSVTAQWTPKTYEAGDIIEYGSYPQTEVTDSALISVLNAQTLQGDSTVAYDGSKYKRVYFETAANENRAINGYNINTVYWFKFEPVQWRVLSNTNGELFVMAEKILDSTAYNRIEANVTWETGTIRSWLNNDFYNTAFNSTEQARIKTSTVVNANNPWQGTPGGNNTNDKLFLLSYAEVMDAAYGFSSNYNDADSARMAQGTDFAKSNGLYTETDSSLLGNSFWWLRSPGINPYSAGPVESAGNVYYDPNDFFIIYLDWLGARPVFKINLSADTSQITFNSAGGSAVQDLVGNIGDAVPAPALTTRTGYTFAGWEPALPETFPAGGLAVTAKWEISTGGMIEYGSYPQTEVTDSALISALNAQTLQGDSTVAYDGSKYKRVYFETAANENRAINGYNINTVYWFKFEPVQWRVLSNTNGELFVMAEKLLDSTAYNRIEANVTWETCTMRSWLNNDFYNTAFNSTEQARIITSTVVNDDNPLNNTEGGNNTSDKLFLLSYAEVMDSAYGFGSNYNEADSARMAQGTDFAKSNGLYVSADNQFLGSGIWWLRSPGINPYSAGCVESAGNVNYDLNNFYIVYLDWLGARPVFRVNPSAAISTITFDSVGGTEVAPITGKIGDPVVAPADPIKFGYTFAGWNPALPVSFPISGFEVTAQWSANHYSTGDIIEYGSYPQSRVTDSGLLTVLNSLTPDIDNIVTCVGVKYKKVFFTQYTAYYGGNTTEPGLTYQDNNGYYINTVYWFKFEPVQWRVLSNANDELFVMADKILDSKAYNQVYSGVTWETCTIRSWLNNDFYNSTFNSTELLRIKTSAIVNEDNSWLGTDGGNNTCDKLFLLSYSEAMNTIYGFSSSDSTDAARLANSTDFSKSNGLYITDENYYTGKSLWWLRSPGLNDQEHYAYGAGFVDYDGHINHTLGRGSYGVLSTEIGIRPVFEMKLPSEIITPKTSSSCVVDNLYGYIYGLPAGITSLDSYVDVAAGYELSYEPDTGILRTGTVVNVKKDGVVVESYKIVIFGDVNGDGVIDTTDADTIINIGNYVLPQWDPVIDAVYIKAGDVFRDGIIDENDYGVILDIQNYK